MIRFILILLSYLSVSPLCAEMIGSVEYCLPNEGKGWKVANELKDKKIKSTTILYIPENTDMENAKESFGVHVNNLESGSMDQASLERPIQLQFPQQKVQVNILEKRSNSVLYEWTVSSDEKEEVHGWTRGFSYPQESIMLIYLTNEIDRVELLRPIWLETLRKAKFY